MLILCKDYVWKVVGAIFSLKYTFYIIIFYYE